MTQFREDTRSIKVPLNTGIEGFLRTVREILKKPRIQELKIDSNGVITYRRFVKDDEESIVPIEVDFEDIYPHTIIRNSEVSEVAVLPGETAAATIGRLFDLVAQEQLTPVAFVTGADSKVATWYRDSVGTAIQSGGVFFGLPLYGDRQVPDTALLLCAAYGSAALIDTRKAYKIEMAANPLHFPPVEIY